MQKDGQTTVNLLKKARLSLGYTQQMLADFAGVGKATIQRAESGKPLRPDTVHQLCLYFSECFKRTVTPLELGLMYEESAAMQIAHQVIFDPLSYSYLGFSHLQKSVESDKMTLQTTRYLKLTSDQLIQKYAEEETLQVLFGEVSWVLPQVCVFDNSKHHIPVSAITVELDSLNPEYIIPTKLETKAEDILQEIGHLFHDSTTIRLNRVIHDHGHIALLVSKAHYLEYVATNYAMDALLMERGWTKTLRDVVNPGKRLEPLETSLLANHIGVNVLVFTSDNYLLLPMRSHEKVGIWHQQMMASISGAASYDDDMWGTQSGPVAAWIREGREELGLENSDFGGPAIFLGITRELLRGGKPEFFFAVHLAVSRFSVEQKFVKARDRWENKELRWFEFTTPLNLLATNEDRATFVKEFSLLTTQYQSTLSQPLQASLALWFKYMMEA